MNGVTILDTIEIYVLSGWQVVLGMAPLFVAAIIMFVRMYKAFKKGTEDEQAMMALIPEHWDLREFYILLIGCIISVGLTICLENCCPAKYIETHYKVKVDETASFVEFHNKYEVIEEKQEYFLAKERVD